MEPGSTSSTNDTAKMARRRRKLILAHRRSLRKNLTGKPPTVMLQPMLSPMLRQTHAQRSGSAKGPNHLSPGIAFSTRLETGQSSNVASVARKRRREILSNRNNVENHPNKENFPLNKQSVVITS